MTQVKETAGALANRALSNDNEDPWDLAKEWTKDVFEEVWKCIDHAKKNCPDPEFCVVMIYASDCVIKNCIRRKFYAWPWMPQPRPRQSVWLYRRSSDDIQGLWCLPEAYSMARLAEDITVPKQYNNMAEWCRAFFRGNFSATIRRQAGISLLTEEEHNRPLLKKSESMKNDAGHIDSDAFDFFKPFVKKSEVVDSSKPLFS